jgi:hypothetical protein
MALQQQKNPLPDDPFDAVFKTPTHQWKSFQSAPSKFKLRVTICLTVNLYRTSSKPKRVCIKDYLRGIKKIK